MLRRDYWTIIRENKDTLKKNKGVLEPEESDKENSETSSVIIETVKKILKW